MNSNNSNKNNTTNSNAMDLENLQQKYSELLVKYKAAVSEYILFLNNSSSDSNTPQFVSIQGQAYLGTGSAGQSTATNLQDCIASCSSNSKCSGATFVSNKCDIRSGDSSIITSSNDSYAIVPKSKQLLLNMETLNQQLLVINKEINDKIQIYQPQYYTNTEEGKQKRLELIKNYVELNQERNSLTELLSQHDTLDSVDDENQIKINQNYYSYILLMILVIVIFFLLYKMSSTSVSSNVQYGGSLGLQTYIIILIMILIIIAINYFTHS